MKDKILELVTSAESHLQTMADSPGGGILELSADWTLAMEQLREARDLLKGGEHDSTER